MTTDTAATLARMDAARIGPHITCPVSRHAAMMAEAMMRGEPYVMMTEERKYCGSSIGETVASLWAARAEIARLREALTFYTVPGNWRIGGPLDGNSGNYTGGPAGAALAACKGV